MHVSRLIPILALLVPAGLATTASAQFALTWSGILADSTKVTVVDFYATEWPGKTGQPHRRVLGDVPATGETASDTPPVLHAVFGDSLTLAACTLTEDQGPVHRDGDDGYFFARPGVFAGAEAVTVFFAWSGSLRTAACEPTTGVRFDLANVSRPGKPGKPFLE